MSGNSRDGVENTCKLCIDGQNSLGFEVSANFERLVDVLECILLCLFLDEAGVNGSSSSVERLVAAFKRKFLCLFQDKARIDGSSSSGF